MKGIRSRLNTLLDMFSYSAEVRNLVAILNRRIEQPESVSIHIPSHPSGFSREIHKRRLSIAEAYIRIIHALDSDKYEERLKALESLVRHSLHAKTVSMPLNTARVQVALMKEAVKNADNRQRQLELMMEFTRASYGQETVIRGLLREHGLIEVTETGKPLSEMDLGWDDHVHDNLSEGRKTPTQVMLDAFIKGISGVTLAYYDLADERIIREALRSGEILGIRVRIGIEFSVGLKGARRHYMYIPDGCRTAEDYIAFFARHREKLSHFLQGLHRNAESRHKTIGSIFNKFNETYLGKLNEGFNDLDYLVLKPLQWEDLQSIVLNGQASRMHLGELLYRKFKQILHKRLMYYRTLYEVALQRKSREEISRWEFDMVSSRYESIRKQYETLTSECLRSQYFSDRNIVDYDSAFREEKEIFPALNACGGELIYIHPLELGLSTAVGVVIRQAAFITHIETFNMRDSVRRNPTDLRLLSSFVSLLNGGQYEEVQRFVEEWSVPAVSEADIMAACSRYSKEHLVPRCGSDSTGRDPLIPGMGFVAVETIPKRMRASFTRRHIVLPQPVANLILSRGEPVPEGSREYSPIVSMGKSGVELKNMVGDEEEVVYLSPLRIWKYLNPGIRNFLKVFFGFIPAFLGGSWTAGWNYAWGLTYALIWFGITFTRNVVVDLVSSSGLDPKDWAWKDVDMDNATSSLFWTGFSVPILTFVKLGFDYSFRGLQQAHIVAFETLKYFFIAFFNGSYIIFHNTLRGFNPKVRSRNFFRTLLSWPFATVFSPVGDFLGIPSIVQSKFWSDFVAGFIEGSGKLSLRMKLRERDIGELLPLLFSQDRQERITAMLDSLYIWARSRRGETVLYNILMEKVRGWKKPGKSDGSPSKGALDGGSYRRRLHDLFTEEGALETLNKYILVHFEGKEALVLTDLLGRHYLPFVNWLERIEKKTVNQSAETKSRENKTREA
jgi:hypothetical protein